MEAEEYIETPSESPEAPTNLVPCSVCGRTFRPEALARHEKICQKTVAKKRKVYDSSKKRAEGTELASLPKPKASDLKKEKLKPKSNWREKHQEFIQAIRAAKGGPDDDDQEIMGASKPISVPVGYVQCPTCGRNFNERAADRHISWCKEQKHRIARSGTSKDASERLKARTKYRAPLPSRKESSAKSEKKSLPAVPSTRLTQESPTSTDSKSSTTSNKILPKRNVVQPKPKKVIKLPVKPRKPSPEKSLVVKKNPIVRAVEPQRRNTNNGKSAAVTRNIMKFKEKFPNHIHRNLMVDENDDEFQQDLRDLLRNNTVFSKAPRTVPGVRTGGQTNANETNNRNAYRSTDDVNVQSLQERMKELGTSFRNGNVDFDMGWAKKLSHWDTRGAGTDNMPQIGSSESQFGLNNPDPWAPVSADETRASTGNSSSSSDSTLPPISRGSSGSDMGNRLPRFCHQCGTKYPVTIAKYCCECGARRVSNVVVVS